MQHNILEQVAFAKKDRLGLRRCNRIIKQI